MSVSEFFHMGGYAPYVWSCYGVTLLVLVGTVWVARRQLTDELIRARRRSQTATE